MTRAAALRGLSALVLFAGVACRSNAEAPGAPSAHALTEPTPPPNVDAGTRRAGGAAPAAAGSEAVPAGNPAPSGSSPGARAARPLGTKTPTAEESPSAASASVASAVTAPAPSVDPARDAIAPRRGAVASGEGYRAWLRTSGGYTAGTSGSVIVELAVSAPFHANPQYPYKFTLDPAPDGVSYPSTVVRGMQVEGLAGSANVPFTPSRAGTFPIGGTLSFSICAEDRCLIDKAHVTVTADAR